MQFKCCFQYAYTYNKLQVKVKAEMKFFVSLNHRVISREIPFQEAKYAFNIHISRIHNTFYAKNRIGMEAAKKEEKLVVCFLQPDFIQHVKGQENPCFDVTAFDDATVFHVRLRDFTSKAKAPECTQNGHDVGVRDPFKVSLKILSDEENLGDAEKIESALSESFGKEETGKSEFLLIFGEIMKEKEEKEDGIKVCTNFLHNDQCNYNITIDLAMPKCATR